MHTKIISTTVLLALFTAEVTAFGCYTKGESFRQSKSVIANIMRGCKDLAGPKSAHTLDNYCEDHKDKPTLDMWVKNTFNHDINLTVRECVLDFLKLYSDCPVYGGSMATGRYEATLDPNSGGCMVKGEMDVPRGI